MTVKDQVESASPMVDRLNDAIRENPLAAGLIGAGIAWMLFGTKGFRAAGKLVKDASDKGASAVISGGAAAASGVRKTGTAVAAAARDAASSVSAQAGSIVPDMPLSTDGAADTVDEMRSAAGERLQSAAASGREYGAALQSRLSQSLERQPLLLGAIGLAIGAGIASTFAITDIEREWLGEQGEAARDALQGAVDDAKDRARAVLSDVQEEAARQGLTVDAAKEAASTVAGRAGNIAREAVQKPFTTAG